MQELAFFSESAIFFQCWWVTRFRAIFLCNHTELIFRAIQRNCWTKAQPFQGDIPKERCLVQSETTSKNSMIIWCSNWTNDLCSIMMFYDWSIMNFDYFLLFFFLLSFQRTSERRLKCHMGQLQQSSMSDQILELGNQENWFLSVALSTKIEINWFLFYKCSCWITII